MSEAHRPDTDPHAPGSLVALEGSGELAAGSVWPAAVLLGAGGSALLAAGTWFGAATWGTRAPVGIFSWVAEHAVWGTLAGLFASTAVSLVADRRRPDPASAASRRAVAARVSLLAVVAAHLGLFAWTAAVRGPLPGAAIGLFVGIAALALTLRRVLHVSWTLTGLPRFDPIRVAAVVALLASPRFVSRDPLSLVGAWRVMLGG